MVDRLIDPPTIPSAMWSIRLRRPGDPAALAYEQIQTPSPGQGEVLVRVEAAAITRDELDWPADRLPATPSYEFSGIVAEVGRGVDDLAAGPGGLRPERVRSRRCRRRVRPRPREVLAPKPGTLGHVESASLPLAGLSAWQGLFDHGRLREGGGCSSTERPVGWAAWRCSSRMCVAPSSSGPPRRRTSRPRALGADEVIDHTATQFDDVVGQVDLVFDTVGGDRLERSLALLGKGGRLVSVASKLRGRSGQAGVEAVYFVVEPNRIQLVEIARLADGSELRPSITQSSRSGKPEAFERSLGQTSRQDCQSVVEGG